MKRIVVFCGSASGNQAAYINAATETGSTLAARGIHVVYGGARIGIMGAVADAALNAGGTVTGVIPQFLKTKEVAHAGLTELITVDNMHERKLKMHELCDGIIALPGGWGTLEELFEVLTWGQLGLHAKPVGLLNVNGYYDALIAMCDKMVQDGFLAAHTRTMLLTSTNLTHLLQQMDAYKPVVVAKWMTTDRT
jgi:hypothetical protein